MRKESYNNFVAKLKEIYSKQEIDFFWKELDRYDLLDNPSTYKNSIIRLTESEPIQYITGQAYFYDCELYVNSDTLIPRPETEELVDLIIQDFKDSPTNMIEILDVGTGSGCIPIVLARHLKSAKLTALDISTEALAIARRNADRYGLDICFIESDIRAFFTDQTFNVIVSNPPYIPELEKALMHKNVLEYEPGLALFVSNEDRLIYYRLIADFAWKNLRSEGYLYFECNEYNAKDVLLYVEHVGFRNATVIADLQGKDRILRAQKLQTT